MNIIKIFADKYIRESQKCSVSAWISYKDNFYCSEAYIYYANTDYIKAL